MKLNVYSTTTSDEELAQLVEAVLRPREIEVLHCVMHGKQSKQIAFELGITDRTVDAHRRNICIALGIKTPAEQVILAWRIRNHIVGFGQRVDARCIDNVDNPCNNCRHELKQD